MKKLLFIVVLASYCLQASTQNAPVYYEFDDKDEDGNSFNNNQSYTYNAADYISLKPGFEYKAQGDDFFHAFIYPGDQDYALPTYQEFKDPTTTPVNKNLPVGSLPMTLDVDNRGSATFQIPIELASASYNFLPNLNIIYNSSMKSGLLGESVHLSGFSEISRTGKTFRLDGIKTGINFNQKDAIEIDGSRLIRLNGDNNLNDVGAIYATQQENFARIVKSADGFIAYFKDGRIIEYGNTVNSRQELTNINSTVCFAWKASKITDKHGNYYTIQYKHFANGEVLPHIINYTGNETASVLPYQQVKFNYMEINDVSTKYIKGYKINQTKVVSSIEAFSEGKLFRKYRFKYFLQNGSTRLNEITLTGVNGIQYNPTILGWNTTNFEGNHYSEALGGLVHNMSFGDYNGDGRTDLFALKENSQTSEGYWTIFYNILENHDKRKNTGFFRADPMTEEGLTNKFESAVANNKIPGVTSSNFGFTVKDHLIGIIEGEENVSFLLNLDDEYASCKCLSAEGYSHLVSDLDGDGFSDIISYKIGDNAKETPPYLDIDLKVRWFRDNDEDDENTEFRNYDLGVYSVENATLKLGDYNGNGIIDLWFISEKGIKIYEYDLLKDDFIAVTAKDHQSNNPDYESTIHLGDFNGDGNTDVLELHIGEVKAAFEDDNGYNMLPKAEYLGHSVYLSNGVYFQPSQDKFFDVFPNDSGEVYLETFYFADITGNGRTDFIHQNIAEIDSNFTYSHSYHTTYFQYNYPTQNKLITKIDQGSINNGLDWTAYVPNLVKYGKKLILADADGDGFLDFMYNSGEVSIYFFPEVTNFNLITSIRDGLGVVKNIEYESISEFKNNVTDYSTNITSSYNRQRPATVVKQISSPQINDGNPFLSFKYSKFNGPGYYFPGEGFLGFGLVKRFNYLTKQLTETHNAMAYSVSKFQFEFAIPQSFIYHKSTKVFALNDQNEVLDEILETTINYNSPVKTSLDHNRFAVYPTGEVIINSLEKTTTTKTFNSYDASGNVTSLTKTLDLKNNEGTATTNTTYTYTSLGSTNFDNALASASTQITYANKPTVTQNLTNNYTPDFYLDYTVTNDFSEKQITTQYHYSDEKKLIYTEKSVTDADPNGVTYPNSVSTVNDYDSKQRFMEISTNALGHTSETDWDRTLGVPKSVTDANNITATFTYDGFGVLTSTTSNNIKTTIKKEWYTGSEFPDVLYTITTEKSGSPSSTIYYNYLGHAVLSETTGYNGLKIRSKTDYNTKGQIVNSYLPYESNSSPSLKHSFVYDDYARISEIKYAYGLIENHAYLNTSYHNNKHTVTLNYNANEPGPDLSSGAPLPQSTQSIMSASGRVSKIINTIGNETTYEYNSFGKPTDIHNFGNTLSITYDDKGNPTSMNDPNMNNIGYDYNALGQLRSYTNPSGIVTQYFYDAIGRLITEKTLSDPERIITYEYDGTNGIGKLKKTYDNNGSSKEITYNDKGLVSRITEISNGRTAATTFGYNKLQQLSTYTYPNGLQLNYTYDANGYLTDITDNNTATVLWHVNTGDVFGNITNYTYGNGITTDKTYDLWGFLSDIVAPNVLNHSYTFQRGLNNLTSRKDNINNTTETFSYDALNRLTEIIKSSFTSNIQYQNNGNISYKTGIGTYNYTSNKPHALTQIKQPEQDYTGRYQHITYNVYQDPTSIKEVYDNNDEYTLNFAYDCTNQRSHGVWKVNSNIVKEKYYNLNSEYIIKDDANTTYNYIYAPTGLVGVQVSTINNSKILYTHQDYLGSISAITNEQGEPIQELSYDAWGRPRRPDNHSYQNIETPLLDRGYTMHEHLPEFGLIHMNGRLYDPAVGRMLSTDNALQNPANDQNYNRYSYVLNNPLKYTDPTGENYDMGTHGGNSDLYDNNNYMVDGLYMSNMTLQHMKSVQGIEFIEISLPYNTVIKLYEGDSFQGLGYKSWSGETKLTNGQGKISADGTYTKVELETRTVEMGLNDKFTSIKRKETHYKVTKTDFWDTMPTHGGAQSGGGQSLGSQIVNNVLTGAGAFSAAMEASYASDAQYVYRYAQGSQSATQITQANKALSNKIASGFKLTGRFVTGLNLTFSAYNSATGNARNGSFVYDVINTSIGFVPFVGVPLSITGAVYKNDILDYGAKHPYHGSSHTRCFVAGTPVYGSSDFVNIELLKVNDTLSTYNVTTGMVELMQVSHTSNRIAINVYQVITNLDTFIVTREHPFFVEGKNWVEVKNLKAGDELRSLLDTKISVIKIEKLAVEKVVYNIEVNGNHNFYVGQGKVLVHNKTRNQKHISTEELNKKVLIQKDILDETRNKK